MSRIKYGNGEYHRIGYNNSTYRKVAYGTEPVKTLMYKVSEEIYARGTHSASYNHNAITHPTNTSYETYLFTKYTNSQATCNVTCSNVYSNQYGYVCTGGVTMYKSLNGYSTTYSKTISLTLGNFSLNKSTSIRTPTCYRTLTCTKSLNGSFNMAILSGSYSGKYEHPTFETSKTYYSSESKSASSTASYGTNTIVHYYTNN